MDKRVSRTLGTAFLLLEIAVVPKALELMLRQDFSVMSPIGIIVLSMTFGSIALCLLMAFSSLSDHESYPLPTFLFELTVFLCCIAPMTDLMTKALDPAGRPGLNLLVNTAFYLVGINIAYIIMLYEFRIIGAGPALKKSQRTASILMILDNLAILLNARFGFFFTITEEGTYRSAPTYWAAYIIPAVIIAQTVRTAARYMEPGRSRKAFLTFWIPALSASLLQSLLSDLTLQYTGYTLSLIIIYMNVQSELDTLMTKKNDQELR